MPYKNKENLPSHAQEIYLKAFKAWDQYKEPKERIGSGSREETSHKVAWSAVKQKYTKSISENGRKNRKYSSHQIYKI